MEIRRRVCVCMSDREAGNKLLYAHADMLTLGAHEQIYTHEDQLSARERGEQT